MLGAKEDPYPYIKQCDIYVQTSRTEAYCITVREVILLNKLIVSMNFTSIEEQIQNKQTGTICGIIPEELASNILLVISDNSLCKYLNNNIISKNTTILNGLDKLYE